MKQILFIILLASIIFFKDIALAASKWQPGFRTIGIFQSEPPLRIDINLWYPALRAAREIRYNSWKIQGALNARPANGNFPLIILSHPTSGTRFSYASLAAFFAEQGFIVAAPNHERDCLNNMEDLFTWQQLENRIKEILHTIDAVLSEKDFTLNIDKNRIGIIGFGAGATAALFLGGALPNCSSWLNYCEKAKRNDPYCIELAKDKISAICTFFPLSKSLASPQIKAIAAIAPGFGMFFDKTSFQYFYPPLLIVNAKKDIFNFPALHSESIAGLLNEKSLYLELNNADTGALMDECPQNLVSALPELCDSVSLLQRRKLRLTLETSLLTFFNHYLVSNLQNIPEPPILKEKAKTLKNEPKKGVQGKK